MAKYRIREVVKRDVVASMSGFTRTFETLSCGHVQMAKTDFSGETISDSRRCRKCAQNLPADDINKVVGEWIRRTS